MLRREDVGKISALIEKAKERTDEDFRSEIEAFGAYENPEEIAQQYLDRKRELDELLKRVDGLLKDIEVKAAAECLGALKPKGEK